MNLHVYLSFVFLFTVSSVNADENKFSNWDQDNDQLIERHEFVDEFTDRFFDAWNPENERGILEEDFLKSSYAGLDTDHDGLLKDEEWVIGYNYFYDDYLVYDGVEVIDTDGDGFIDFSEYYDVIYETDYFTDVDLDSDNFISEYELANFVFDNWDLNNSGLISKSEFKEFKWYYLDV